MKRLITNLTKWMSPLIAMMVLGCKTPEEKCMELGGGFEDADLDALEAECMEDGGEYCDPDAYMEMEAAKCFAQIADLKEGNSEWTANLGYSEAYNTMVWAVQSFDAPEAGHGILINAVTGDVVGGGEYVWDGSFRNTIR